MIEELKPLIKKFIIFAKDNLNFQRPPRLFLRKDAENSKCALGKTAHYDPGNQAITLYITNRHPKDILRSFAHELVHHCQNERGDLSPEKMKTINKNYAQENDHMRKMEQEAYLMGNMCFRDWEDSLDNKLQYRMHVAEQKYLKENKKMSVKITKKFLRETIQKALNNKILSEQGFALGIPSAKTPEQKRRALEQFYNRAKDSDSPENPFTPALLWDSTKLALNTKTFKPSERKIQEILSFLMRKEIINQETAVGWGFELDGNNRFAIDFMDKVAGEKINTPPVGSYINNTPKKGRSFADAPVKKKKSDKMVAPNPKQPSGVMELPAINIQGSTNESAFAPSHYCVHHGGVEHNGEVHEAKAVGHNWSSRLNKVTHYDMELLDGTILENVAVEDIMVTKASLAEGSFLLEGSCSHSKHKTKRVKENEESENENEIMEEEVEELEEAAAEDSKKKFAANQRPFDKATAKDRAGPAKDSPNNKRSKEAEKKDKEKEKKPTDESKIQTPEQENTLYEQRFTKKNTKLFEKLLKEWTK